VVATGAGGIPVHRTGELVFAVDGTLQETAVFDALGQGFEARVIGDSLLIERDGSSSALGFVEERADTAPGTLTPR
jgi:hypothetical protein